MNLDPAKLLVIAVVAIILLGPDKLPQVARQVGGAWRSFNEFRHRMETEVRNTMPDLPSTTEIARLARSPSALLDHLSNMGPADEATEVGDDGEAGAVAADGAPSTNGAGPAAVTDAVETAPTGDGTPMMETGPATAPPTTSPEVAPTHAPNPRSPDGIVPGDPSLN